MDLHRLYQDSTSSTPIILIQQIGADPLSAFLDFADNSGMKKRVIVASMGQGMMDTISRRVHEAQIKGLWIIVQNCHITPAFMPVLERIVADLPNALNKEFRLWLTTAPCDYFSSQILQIGIKVIVQPSSDFNRNVQKVYKYITEKDFAAEDDAIP